MPNKPHIITCPTPTSFSQAANSVTSPSKKKEAVKWVLIGSSLLLFLGGCSAKAPPHTAWPSEYPQLTIEQKKEVGAPFYLEDLDGNVIRDINDSPLLAGSFTEPKGNLISKEPLALFYEKPVAKENLMFARHLPGLVSMANFRKTLKRMYKEYIAAKEVEADLIKKEKEKADNEYEAFQDCMTREITITALTGGIIDTSKCQGTFEVRTHEAKTLEVQRPRRQKKPSKKKEAIPQ